MPEWRRLRLALIALALVLVVGSVGYSLLGLTPLDAVYQTVTTITTVGFREVEPFDAKAKVFTIVLVLAGVGVAFYVFGTALELVLEGHLERLMGRRRMDRTIAQLHDHVIVCGWGRVGKAIVHDLRASGVALVVIDIDPTRVEGIDVPVVVGDATDDAVLRSAGLDRARALVATLTTDADNLFVTLSGRAMRPDVFIVARARQDTSMEKLRRAGANRVVNPQELGGARIAAFISQPHVAEFVDVVMHDSDVAFRLEEITVPAGSSLNGCSLRESHLRDRTGALVLALREPDGRFLTNPSPETQLRAGHVLIAIGTVDELSSLERAVAAV